MCKTCLMCTIVLWIITIFSEVNTVLIDKTLVGGWASGQRCEAPEHSLYTRNIRGGIEEEHVPKYHRVAVFV